MRSLPQVLPHQRGLHVLRVQEEGNITMIKYINLVQYKFFKLVAEMQGDYQQAHFWAKQIRDVKR